MKITFNFIIIFAFFSCSTLKQKNDCVSILENEPSFVQNNVTKEMIEKDYEILEKCGEFDNIDKIIFSPPVLGTLMANLLIENQKISYKLILDKINEIKETEDYPEQKKLVILYEKIKGKTINKNEWEKDKLILQKIGIKGEHLNSFKSYITGLENSNITYELALHQFNQLVIEKQSEIKNETTFDFRKLDNYENVLNKAKKENKLILLYFTGWGDVNSRKMEEFLLNDDEIKGILNNDYLAYSLYVDSRKKLKENEIYISKITKKEVKTVGKKFQDFQMEKFKVNRQPYFVIIDRANALKIKYYSWVK